MIEKFPDGNNTSSHIEKQKEKIGYILLGGSENAMEHRVDKVVEHIKNNQENQDNKIIITGYEFEIEKIKNLLKDKLGGEIEKNIVEILSYDTRTNITKIKEEKPELLEEIKYFIIPTSISHSRRVKMVFDEINGMTEYEPLPFTKDDNGAEKAEAQIGKYTLEFLKTKENEAKYAKLGESLYKNVYSRRAIQYASIVMRPRKFTRGYLIPLIKNNKGNRSIKKYLLDCLNDRLKKSLAPYERNYLYN